MNPEEKYKLITSNLQEILGKDDLVNLLKQKNAKIYWGTAPTGVPSLVYLYP